MRSGSEMILPELPANRKLSPSAKAKVLGNAETGELMYYFKWTEIRLTMSWPRPLS